MLEKLFPYSRFAVHKYWTTKNATKILISKMTDNHLYNTINYLNRRANQPILFQCETDFHLLGYTKHFKDQSDLNAKIWKELMKEFKKRKLPTEADIEKCMEPII